MKAVRLSKAKIYTCRECGMLYKFKKDAQECCKDIEGYIKKKFRYVVELISADDLVVGENILHKGKSCVVDSFSEGKECIIINISLLDYDPMIVYFPVLINKVLKKTKSIHKIVKYIEIKEKVKK